MYHLGARWYDSNLRRFITVDPDPGDSDDPISLNEYVYTGNNPITRVDPDGNRWKFALDHPYAAGAIIGVISGIVFASEATFLDDFSLIIDLTQKIKKITNLSLFYFSELEVYKHTDLGKKLIGENYKFIAKRAKLFKIVILSFSIKKALPSLSQLRFCELTSHCV